MDECLTVRELIEKLKELDQDCKIRVSRCYKKEDGVSRYYSVPIKGITECIEMDTNKTLYSIEPLDIDVKALIDDYMKGLSYE